MHTTTGQWRVGFALALTAATLWGLLPIALKIVLGGMDPYTITWYRFATSGAILGVILAAAKNAPPPEWKLAAAERMRQRRNDI